jgi:hypothetical protein
LRKETAMYDALEYQCAVPGCDWALGSKVRRDWEGIRLEAKLHLAEVHGLSMEDIGKLEGRLTSALDSTQFSCNTTLYSKGEEPFLRRVMQVGRYRDDMMYLPKEKKKS